MILANKIKKIKMVVTDIDGVWTDGKMYYTASGDSMRGFSTYDGMAVGILQKKGITLAIISGEDSEIVASRAQKLGVDEVYLGEKEKIKRLMYLVKKYNINIDEVAFIGDDILDIECLESVGLSALSANSPIIGSCDVDLVTERAGGDGAFREFIDIILAKQP